MVDVGMKPCFNRIVAHQKLSNEVMTVRTSPIGPTALDIAGPTFS